jgi:hypothetical protein
MQDESDQPVSPPAVSSRRGAIGKALIVWLASGSLGLAVVAYLIFAAAGC